MLPTFFNHLLQSTLFAAAAGLLTLAFRKNRAQVRYALWLAASVKFLIPFSVLIAMGSHFAWRASAGAAQSGLSFVVEQVSQPFASPVAVSIAPAVSHVSWTGWIPSVLSALWVIGFLIVVTSWWRRWRDLRAVLRDASPLRLPNGIEALTSPEFGEPGVYGIRRPVLLLPTGIVDELTSAQLEAILAHELCHIRRRDNLAAAIHMAVEAVFWFHPLVWWLGARLMDERERACDEEVLHAGSEPQVYAEGLLKICELYLESPLQCVAGVTGANLRQRIEAIMANRFVLSLTVTKKMILAAAGTAALAFPAVLGMFNAVPTVRSQPAAAALPIGGASGASSPAPLYTSAGTVTAPSAPIQIAQVRPAPTQPKESPTTPPPEFDSASIKPYVSSGGGSRGVGPGGPAAAVITSGGLRFTPGRVISAPIGVTARKIIMEAFHLTQFQLSGGPGWLDSDRFSLEAKAEGADESHLREMLRTLLAKRFRLALRAETREMPVYDLVVGKNGTKLHEWKEGDPMPEFHGPQNFRDRGTMQHFADFLSGAPGVDRPVLERTGLQGIYVFYVEWEDDGAFLPAMQEQLGLKLAPDKAPIETFVIDQIEKPDPN